MQISFDFVYEDEFKKFCLENGLSKSMTKFIIFLPEALLIADTMLKFISGYYENGMIVTQKKIIIKHYLKRGLFFDLLAYLPIILHGLLVNYVNDTIIKLIQLFMFCKLKRVVIALYTFQEIISSKGREDYVLNALRLILIIVFVTHLCACSWHAVAFFTNQKENWISIYNFQSSSWGKKYLISLFCSVSLFGGIGFGDRIMPQNEIEHLLGVFLVLLSFLLYGYTIYSIFNIMKSMQKKEKEYKLYNNFLLNNL